MSAKYMAAAACLTALTAAARAAPAFEVRVLDAPQYAATAQNGHIVYELAITNTGRRTWSITGIDISDANAMMIETIAADALEDLIWRAPREPGENGLHLHSGETVYLFMDVLIERYAEVPSVLAHAIHARREDRDESETLRTAAERVSSGPCLAAAFEDGDWFAYNSIGNTSGHRRTAVPLDGKVFISQRFAVDWVKMGEDGAFFRGDASRDENWHGYGVPVRSITDGVVVRVLDGLAENTPLEAPAVSITLETIAGNHVVVQTPDGLYALYGHLQPGSVTVAEGDTVSRGDGLGLLGNSGNSDAPHLHFHLADGPDALGAQGRPFALDAFTLASVAADPDAVAEGADWEEADNVATGPRECEAVPNGAFVSFSTAD